MKKLSFFLAISLATIVMLAGCKDKKPLKELTGTRWKSEVSEIKKGDATESIFYAEMSFVTNKDAIILVRHIDDEAPEMMSGEYIYSYPNIKIVLKEGDGDTLGGEFSDRDRFTVYGPPEASNISIIFHREK